MYLLTDITWEFVTDEPIQNLQISHKNKNEPTNQNKNHYTN